MKRAGQIIYFAIAGLIFLGFFYLGVTREFSTGLDVGFVAVLWVFVVIAMKTGLVKTAPGAGLPLSNLRVKFNARNLFLAIVSAALAIAWLRNYFAEHPEAVEAWLRLSWDNRSWPSWYLQDPRSADSQAMWVVG